LSPLDVLGVINQINKTSTSLNVQLELRNDSGLSQNDKITNDSALIGQFGGSSGVEYVVKARVNRGPVLDLNFDSAKRFSLDVRSLGFTGDGSVDSKVFVSGSNGVTGIARLASFLDTTPPEIFYAGLNPLDDTGRSNADGITRVANPRFRIQSDPAVRIELSVGSNVIFDGSTNGFLERSIGSLEDNRYDISVSATDVAGNSRVSNATVILDTIPPIVTSLDLTPSSDSGVLGDRITGYSRVVLKGTTEPSSYATLRSRDFQVRSTGTGDLIIPSILLNEGQNRLVFDLEDISGNTATTEFSIAKVPEVNEVDPVIYWNDIALRMIRSDATVPTIATRNLAMMSTAMLDVINSVERTPSLLVSFATPQAVSVFSAVSSAAYEVLRYLFPRHKETLLAFRDDLLASIPNDTQKQAGLEFGARVGQAVIQLRRNDGWDRVTPYTPGSTVGNWQPTGPGFDVAQHPHWGNVDPFVIQEPNEFVSPAPPSLTSETYARDFNEVKQLGEASSALRTEQQKQIARFWADGAGTETPPGHWNRIAQDIAKSQQLGLAESVRLFARLNTALADTSVVAWQTKYDYDTWRPVTAIANAQEDGNSATSQQTNWQPLLITPPHPEYVSGHSAFSAAASTILSDYFGNEVAFTSESLGLPGVRKSFGSFQQAASEAGRSRIFGGIHFEFSNQAGQELGRQVANEVLNRFRVSEDLRPPKILLDANQSKPVHASNPVIRGWAVDNLSGVKELYVQLDGSPAELIQIDSHGRFSYSPSLLLDGKDQGEHVLRFIAMDFAGFQSAPVDYVFTLDTIAPSVELVVPKNTEVVSGTGLLDAVVSGTGSNLTSLTYRINNNNPIPIYFEGQNAQIQEPLNLDGLQTTGLQTLTLTAVDSSGLSTSITRQFLVPNFAPLTVEKYFPKQGASQIGSTFRPEVVFSRPVDLRTLNASSFYAIDLSGNRLVTNIVPALDGSFAWLFFADGMPSSSTISVIVDGNKIRGLDGQLIDADANGVPGGVLTYSFSTVSQEVLDNTSILGRVVDPGNDLKPMTIDDIKAGPDGILFTSDDVFERPVAGARVFILGSNLPPVFTDAAGYFWIPSAPSGTVKLAIDGRTATNSPAGFFFPEMVLDLNIEVGTTNTVMGSTGSQEKRQANLDRTEVYLPRLRTEMLQDVSDVTTTIITVDAGSSPNLTDEQREQLSLEVTPGSVIGEDGQPLDDAKIGISTVPPELVRDMLPAGLLQHTFDVTIQAPGAAVFNNPLPMRFPNVFNAPPGATMNFLSFDHTTGRLVVEGTATVSKDGLFVSTDPGVGITKPGWHGLTPPGSSVKGPGGTANPCPFGWNASTVLGIAWDFSGAIVDCLEAIAFKKIKEWISCANQVYKSIQDFIDTIRDLIKKAEDGLTGTELVETFRDLILNRKSFFIDLVAKLKDTSPLSRICESLECAESLIDAFQKVCDDYLDQPSNCISRFVKAACLTLVPFKETLSTINTYKGEIEGGLKKVSLTIVCNLIDKANRLLGIIPDGGSGEGEGDSNDELIATLRQMLDEYMILESSYSPLKRFVDDVARVQILSAGITQNVDLAYFTAFGTPRNATVLFQFDDQTIRTTTDDTGNFEAFLPPNKEFTVEIYDAQKNRIGTYTGLTSRAGASTLLPPLRFFRAEGLLDSDSDRLVDRAETIAGTHRLRADTDADGRNDFVEVLQGTNPLGNRIASTGVISSFSTVDGLEKLEIGTDRTGGLLAFGLSQTNKLSVFDVQNPRMIVSLSQIDLGTRGRDLALDLDNNRVVIAGQNDLMVYDVVQPRNPVLLARYPGSYRSFLIHEGLIVADNGASISLLDVQTGEFISKVDLVHGRVLSMQITDGLLFVRTDMQTLDCYSFQGDVLIPRGSVTIEAQGEELFVGGGVAYASEAGGFTTIDVSDPDRLTIIAPVSSNNIASARFAANGSGLGIGVASLTGLGSNLDVVDISDPTVTDRFLSQIALPGIPTDLELAGGLAYVSTSRGLHIVSYRPYDSLGVVPTVSAQLVNQDIDPIAAGIQLAEGTELQFRTATRDDVQVQSVELLADGLVVASDISFPFDLNGRVPNIEPGTSTRTVSYRIRVMDTGGNTTLTEPTVVVVVPDTMPPELTRSRPFDGQVLFAPPVIELSFNESIDVELLAPAEISLVYLGQDRVPGGDDTRISISQITSRNRQRILKLKPESTLLPGNYQLSIAQSGIQDIAGNTIVLGPNIAFTVRPSIAIEAISGTPRLADEPSANPGQWIDLQIPGITINTQIDFPIVDESGNLGTVSIKPSRVDRSSQTGSFEVPMNATTGFLSIPGDPFGNFLLQIVPVIDRAALEFVYGDEGYVVLNGRGFVESDGLYSFGSTEVLDPDRSAIGVDVYDGQLKNDSVFLKLPISSGIAGGISVTTLGGTSAPWLRPLNSISSLAIQGLPNDLEAPSANPGQSVTLFGDGLDQTTSILTQYRDSYGFLNWTTLRPGFAKADGSLAQVDVPRYFNGTHPWIVLGSPIVPTLQIVPRLIDAQVDGANLLRISGYGFEEGSGSNYQIGQSSYTDQQFDDNGIEVTYFRDSDNDTVLASFPNYGFGELTVRTSGGSTSIPANWIKPQVAGTLYDVAFNNGMLWVIDSGTLRNVNMLDGSILASYSPIEGLFDGGLQVLSAQMNLGGTSVPVGSLLVTRSDGDVFAVSSLDGQVLEHLDTESFLSAVGGVFAPTTGKFYILDAVSREMVVVDPADGKETLRWSVPVPISNGSVALDPSGNSIWIASSRTTQVIQMSFAGEEIGRVETTLTPASFFKSNEGITGIDFDSSGNLLLSTKRNVIHRIEIQADSTPNRPKLVRIEARAIDGIATNGQLASANPGQWIEIQGHDFRAGITVEIPIIDDIANRSTLLSQLDLVSDDGTRAWLRLPQAVVTGSIRILEDLDDTQIALQIVPRISNLIGRFGTDQLTTLLGSGFVEGALSLTVAGTTITDVTHESELIGQGSNPLDGNVGENNTSYQLILTNAVEGPVRVFTDGGSFRFEPKLSPDFNPVIVTRLAGISDTGYPQDASIASVHPGQVLRIYGNRLTNSTSVRFPAADDNGSTGFLTRTGSLTPDGTALDIVVPALAVSGRLIVGGTASQVPIQIVPRIDGFSGAFTSGESILLTGVGFSSDQNNPLTVTINGQIAQVRRIRTLSNDDSNQSAPQQFLEIVVPPNVSATGQVTVTSPGGGTGALGIGTVLQAELNIEILTDPGDSIPNAQLIGLAVNSSVDIVGSRIGDGMAQELDVDFFQANFRRGERISLNAISTEPLNENSFTPWIRVFDLYGNEIDFSDDNGSFYVPQDGVYRIAISSSGNKQYDPNTPQSGSSGETGQYLLNLQRQQADQVRIGSIRSTASSGVPSVASVSSAIVGQSIEISVPSGGLTLQTKFVFAGLDDQGELIELVVPVDMVSDDGTYANVTVPTRATTGRIRLLGERAGGLIQIVPTVTDLEMSAGEAFKSSAITFRGTGFTEGNLQIAYGQMAVHDWSKSIYPNDVSDENRKLTSIVPQWASHGPIVIRTIGGESDPLNLRLDSVLSQAITGTPKNPMLASANPGQSIRLTGANFSSNTKILFQMRRSDGLRYEKIILPNFVSEDRTTMDVVVPDEAVTSTLRLIGDSRGQSIALQIVPVVEQVSIDSISNNTARVLLRGRGFIESNGTYNFGSTGVIDPDASTVSVDVYSQLKGNDSALLSLPLSENIAGAITVTNEGGTSAPWIRSFNALIGTAIQGVPRNPDLPSANPGQSVTLEGEGLSTSTKILVASRNSQGVLNWSIRQPATVTANGSTAQVNIPLSFNGSNSWIILGSAFAPKLQIVPRLLNAQVDGVNLLRIDGYGFEEGSGSTYFFGQNSFHDLDFDDTEIDVISSRDADNDTVLAYLTNYGLSNLIVSTSGGSSSIQTNWLKPNASDTLYDIAFANDHVWLIDSGVLRKVRLQDGMTIDSYQTVPGLSNGGLQVLQAPLNLNGVSVPSGSLLVTRSDGDLFAVSSEDGQLLAHLDTDPFINAVGGVYSASQGVVFILDSTNNQIHSINPSNGLSQGVLSVPLEITNGSLTLNPSDDSIWIATDESGDVVRLNYDGLEIQRFDASLQGVLGGITGIDFNDTGYLLVSTRWNAIYIVDPDELPLRLSHDYLLSSISYFPSFANQDVIQKAKTQAIDIWSGVGLPSGLLAILSSVEIRYANLGSGLLGLVTNNSILIDDDAAGLGWDYQSEESSDGAMDIVSVLLHEMGHILGLDDHSDESNSSLMFNKLRPKETRRPSAQDVDKAIAIWDSKD
jgi:archaellum component FlaG (FlaF/FlaG flagellin family)